MNTSIGYNDNEYDRFTKAEGVSNNNAGTLEDYIQAMGSIVDLLAYPILREKSIDIIDGDPELLLPFHAHDGETLLAVITSMGKLIIGGIDWNSEQKVFGENLTHQTLDIPDFKSGKSHALGLYFTKKASLFKELFQLIIVMKTEGTYSVYSTQQQHTGKSVFTELVLEGSNPPKWMQTCPVILPLKADIFDYQDTLKERIPDSSQCAAVLSAGSNTPDIYYASEEPSSTEPNAIAGTLIAPLEKQLICLNRNQKIWIQPLEDGSQYDKPLSRYLRFQPMSLAAWPKRPKNALPDEHPAILTGFEYGRIFRYRIINKDIENIWKKLRDNILSNSDTVNKLLKFIDTYDPKDSELVAVLVALFDYCNQPDAPVKMEEKHLKPYLKYTGFIQSLPLSKRLVATLRTFVESEKTEKNDSWETIISNTREIYLNLPFDQQDLIDQSIQQFTNNVKQPVVGLEKFQNACMKTQSDLLESINSSSQDKPFQRAFILAQRWLDMFVPDKTCFIGEPGRLRVHNQKVFLLRKQGYVQLNMEDLKTTEETTTYQQKSIRHAWLSESRNPGIWTIGKDKIYHGEKSIPLPEEVKAIKKACKLNDREMVLLHQIQEELHYYWWDGSSWRHLTVQGSANERPYLFQTPKEFIGFYSQNRRWVVYSESKDEIRVCSWADDGLSSIMGRRRVNGYIRSLTCLEKNDHEMILFIGTTTGCIYGFILHTDKAETGFGLSFFHQTDGSILHLDATYDAHGAYHLLGYTSQGKVFSVDERGCTEWSRFLGTPLVTACWWKKSEPTEYEEDGQLQILVTDKQGIFYSFESYHLSRKKPYWSKIKDTFENEQFKSPPEDLPYYQADLVTTLHKICNPKKMEALDWAQRNGKPPALGFYGRLAVVQVLADQLAQGRHYELLQPVLDKAGQLNTLPLSALRRLTQIRDISKLKQEEQEGVLVSLRDVAFPVEKHMPHFLFIHDLLCGVGRFCDSAKHILTPKWLANKLDDKLHNIPKSAPALYLHILLQLKQRFSKEHDHSMLCTEAARLGPISLSYLPLVVADTRDEKHRFRWVNALIHSVEKKGINCDWAQETFSIEQLPTSIRFLSAILHFNESTRNYEEIKSSVAKKNWEDALEPCLLALFTVLNAPSSYRSSMKHIPALNTFFNTIPNVKLTLQDLRTKEVRKQIDILNNLNFKELAAYQDRIWGDWVEKAYRQFKKHLETIVFEYIRFLRERPWLILSHFKLVSDRDSVYTLTGKMKTDGITQGFEEADITVESGLLGLETGLTLTRTLNQLPMDFFFKGTREPNCSGITIRSQITSTSRTEHMGERLVWRIPFSENVQSNISFLQIPACRDALLAKLVKADKILNIVGFDPTLGTELSALNLAEEGFSLIECDPLFEHVTLPALTTNLFIEKLGLEQLSKGRQIILYHAEHTANRLLTPTKHRELVSLKHRLQDLSFSAQRNIKLYWHLPYPLASKLDAAMGSKWPHCQFIPLHILSPKLHAPVLNEISTWLTTQANPTQHSPEDVHRQALRWCGGDLGLLQKWFNSATPPQLDRDGIRNRLNDLIHGLPPSAQIALFLSGTGSVRVKLKNIRAGLKVQKDHASTTWGKTLGKVLIKAGEQLTPKIITQIRSDVHPPSYLEVSGFTLELGDNQISQFASGLLRISDLGTAEAKTLVHQLKDRGLIEEIHGIIWLKSPYAEYIQTVKTYKGEEALFSSLLPDPLSSHSFQNLQKAGNNLNLLLPGVSQKGLKIIDFLGTLESAHTTNITVKARHDTFLSLARLLCNGKPPTNPPAWAKDFEKELQRRLGSHALLAHIATEKMEYFFGYCQQRPQELALMAKWLNEQAHAVVVLLGPGILDEHKNYTSRYLSLLTKSMMKEIIKSTDLVKGFIHFLRYGIGLNHFSPFQPGNYLPPESPCFVGRQSETRTVLEGIHKHSFLILGCRQIGKTSLLMHLKGRLEENGEHTVFDISCEGVKSTENFLEVCHKVFTQSGIDMPTDSFKDFYAFETVVRKLKNPVLLLNEVDGLVQAEHLFQAKVIDGAQDTDNSDKLRNQVITLGHLRRLSEAGVLQVIMTGYHGAYGGLYLREHPFYHWTRGQTGYKAFFLNVLSQSAATQLMGLLFEPPLELEWKGKSSREDFMLRLYHITHGIPLFLQAACQLILDHLDREKRLHLYDEDVNTVIRDMAGLVWNQLNQEVHAPFQTAKTQDGIKKHTESPEWHELILGALVWKKYFASRPAPAPNKPLSTTGFEFSVSEAQGCVESLLEELLLNKNEKQQVLNYLTSDYYRRFFDSLTLSITLLPTSNRNRFTFNRNIYPIELKRHLNQTGYHTDILEYLLNLVGNILEQLDTGGHSDII